MLVQKLDSLSALLSALEFGRWIKVPIIKLGEARKNFMTAQEARKRQVRKGAAGVPPGSADAPAAGDVDAADAPADAPAAAEPEAQLEGALSPSPPRRRKKGAPSAAETERKKIQAKLEALAVAENERSQQKLSEFRMALKKNSQHYQRYRQKLMSDPMASPVMASIMARSSWHDNSVRVDAEAHFMAQEAFHLHSRLPRTKPVSPTRQVGFGEGGPMIITTAEPSHALRQAASPGTNSFERVSQVIETIGGESPTPKGRRAASSARSPPRRVTVGSTKGGDSLWTSFSPSLSPSRISSFQSTSPPP